MLRLACFGRRCTRSRFAFAAPLDRCEGSAARFATLLCTEVCGREIFRQGRGLPDCQGLSPTRVSYPYPTVPHPFDGNLGAKLPSTTRLPHGEERGYYEISVPGGGVVLKADVRRLQVYLAAEGEQLFSEGGPQQETLRDLQASCGERHIE